MSKTNAEMMKERRDRRKAEGKIIFTKWIYPEIKEEMEEFMKIKMQEAEGRRAIKK